MLNRRLWKQNRFKVGVCIKHDFTPEQIRALADFWSVFANPKFVYETQDKVKEKKEKKDKEQQQKEEEQKKKDQEKKDNKPSPSEKLKDMQISEEKAKMILEAMKNQEVQYLQQNKRKATKPKDKGKPDW